MNRLHYVITAACIASFLSPAFLFADTIPDPGPIVITASDVTTTTPTNTPLTITLSATSTDVSVFVFATSSNPAHGVLDAISTVDDSSASVQYTPESGFSGSDTFTYIASSGPTTSNTATISITVEAAADTTPPIITPPVDQSFATTTFPAIPTLVFATATDAVDPSPIITVSTTTFSLGTTTVTWTATDTSGNVATTTSQIGIYTSAETATIALRDGSTLIGPFTIELPTISAAAVPITPTGSTTAYSVPARSVLALLTTLDAAQSEFEITDLQYSNSFGSFFIACISVPAASATDECYNWQFAVNGIFPMVGADAYTVASGDAANLFFGDSWRISADKTTATTDESFTATAEKYDPTSGTFIPASGSVIGILSIPDPGTPWIYTEIATSTADANGQGSFIVSTSGSYSIGISDSGYYPLISITISEPTTVSSGGGGGGGGGISHQTFNVPLALSYLSSQQNTDGSFSSSVLTDWAALAFAAQDPGGTAKSDLYTYLLTAQPTVSLVTDYERHAMALMALGINPYSGSGTDYITPIVNAFDGTQIGDSSLDNDDIFALFPLTHAGYSSSDNIIQKTVAFIVSRQSGSGAWDGSADITAAAIQALAPLSSLPDVSTALTKAQNYLHGQQQISGGFGSSFTTSWVMQAIAALGQNEIEWAPAGYYPRDYLALQQQPDGGVEATSASAQTRVWATEYAIVGSLGKTWGSLLNSFSKPATASLGASGDDTTVTVITTTADTTTATSTPIATSTTALATSDTQETPVVVTEENQAPPQVIPASAPAQQERTVATVKAETTQLSTESESDIQNLQVAAAASGNTSFPWWILLTVLLLLLTLAVAFQKLRKKKSVESE